MSRKEKIVVLEAGRDEACHERESAQGNSGLPHAGGHRMDRGPAAGPKWGQDVPRELGIFEPEAVELQGIALQVAPDLVGADAMPAAVLTLEQEVVNDRKGPARGTRVPGLYNAGGTENLAVIAAFRMGLKTKVLDESCGASLHARE